MVLGKLNLSKDGFGQNTFAIDLSTDIDAVVLAASVAETYTIDTSVRFVLLSATADFYVRGDGAATVPSTEVTDGSGAFLNPVLLRVVAAKTLSFISDTACTITILTYS